MRIAVSGTHASGKSTLIAELGILLPLYRVVDEPYYSLLDEGYIFAAEPTVEDFEVQLERSVMAITEDSEDCVLFDRCPADYCGYLAALPEVSPDILRKSVSLAKDALEHLDLIIFVPVEQPDRIDVSVEEGRRLRKCVDRMLREMLVDDAWGFGCAVLEVRGTPIQRAYAVLRHLHSLS